MHRPRRTFLKAAAGLAALKSAVPAPAPAPTLPTVKLGKHDVTRLIVGSNPFYGFSHFNRIYDQVMAEWYTEERVLEVLKRCEANGINTWQLGYRERAVSDLRKYRAQGGRMNVIALHNRDLTPDKIPELVKLGVLGIAHHGGVTDSQFRAGKHAEVREFLKRVRDAGLMVGLSSHNPRHVELVQEQNWDIDFFMTCSFHLTRTPEEIRKIAGELPLPAGEVYLEGDPERMLAVVRRTPKPCLAFKILGAGRKIGSPQQIDEAFRFTYRSIKPGDAAIVGMFPRFKDEVTENASRVRGLLAAS
jgi:hypothetical protein